MRAEDVDVIQERRIDQLVDRLRRGDTVAGSEFFSSKIVSTTLNEKKIIVSGYRPQQVLGALPFTPVIYSTVCPTCIKPQHQMQFRELVAAGLVIPILVGAYREYDDDSRSFYLAHDHVCKYEFDTYRFFAAVEQGARPLCKHCEQKRVEQKCKALNVPNTAYYQSQLRVIFGSFWPFLESDRALMRMAFEASKKEHLSRLELLDRMARVLYQIRLSQAFNAPLVMDEKELGSLPENLSPNLDEAIEVSANLRKLAADGLGLRIPLDIPIQAYIELVKDYQPRISNVISKTVESEGKIASIADVSKNISEINREIERIKGLRRHVILEACLGYYKDNAKLINAALVAGTLGLAGGLVGCLVGVGAAGSAHFAKKKGWIRTNRSVDRLRTIIIRDLQPLTDRIQKAYLGSTAPAISVLSLRRRVRKE